MGPVGFLLGLGVLFVGAIASSPSGQTYTDAVPAPAPAPAIPTPRAKTDTKENCTPTVKAILPKRPNPIVFPANPYDFNPMGLTTIPRSGTKNGAMLQWVMWGRPNKKVFVWDEDLQKGSHYHIYEPISQTKLPMHYYPGDPVPEPWATIFFGGYK